MIEIIHDFKEGDLALAVGLDVYSKYNKKVGKIIKVTHTAIYWQPLSGGKMIWTSMPEKFKKL